MKTQKYFLKPPLLDSKVFRQSLHLDLADLERGRGNGRKEKFNKAR